MSGAAQIVCLIKPQFEAGREKVGKKGVVRDKRVHEEVIEMVTNYALSLGFRVLGLEHSPIRGPEGNIEYLLYMENDEREPSVVDDLMRQEIKELVERAHETL